MTSKQEEEIQKEIECQGCLSIWIIEVDNKIDAKLKQCPLCWDGEYRE